MSQRRRFLFLQGFNSGFPSRLGAALHKAGHGVRRVNFCVGDALYWGRVGDGAWNYRGTLADWPEYLSAGFAEEAFTDVVLMGDARPLHEAAIPVARWYGARVHVFEEGYFRPNWVTLEEGGVNGYSALPRDPLWYREAGRLVPRYGDGEPMGTPFLNLLGHGLGYRLPGALNPLLFPGYETHRPYNGGAEAYGWTRRYLKWRGMERSDNRRIDELIRSEEPFYLQPLQLDSDSQIRKHSGFRGVPYLIKRVVLSFLRNAPADTKLVIKNHPLDTGLVDYSEQVRRIAERFGAQDRLIYLESGHMPTLLKHAQGVVVVNSTVGPSALLHGCPVIALGEAIYDLPGLTFQGTLDEFWHGGQAPDPSLFRDFRNTVIHTTQINGAFYTRKGNERAAMVAARRLQLDYGPLDELKWMVGWTETTPRARHEALVDPGSVTMNPSVRRTG